MMIPQVAYQQRCRPDGLVITQEARVGIDDSGDPGIDAIVGCPRAASPRGVGQPLPEVQFVTLMAPVHPVIDRAAADAEEVSDVFDRLALVEPKQRLDAAPHLSQGFVGGEVLQLPALPWGEYERSHRSTCGKERGSMAHRTLCKDFWPST
jgi:hypothetical protein